MMPAMIGHLDPGQLAALAEIIEIGVVEKELGADVVRAGIDLAFEVVQFLEAVGRAGMPFGKTGHADAESSRVGDSPGAIG